MKPYHESITPSTLTGEALDAFLTLGWFRMHQTVFTTSHLSSDGYPRVHWLRMPLAEIKDRRSHRRIRNINRSFKIVIEDFRSPDAGYEELYARYHQSITFEAVETIHKYLFDDPPAADNIFQTKCISIYDQEKLIAVGYFDVGNDSAAAILNFFDPAYKQYSLGKYLMLIAIDSLKVRGYKFYYPGYLIAGKPKMDYKLFLGKEATQFYNPETKMWEAYHEGLHRADSMNEMDRPIELTDEDLKLLDQIISELEERRMRLDRFKSEGSEIHPGSLQEGKISNIQ